MVKKKKTAEATAGVKDYGVLLAPVITEKGASSGGGTRTRVVFKVLPTATKPEIKKAVEKIFNVKVDSVNTVNYMGKVKRTTTVAGRRIAFKKAYIVLAEGQNIQVVEGL